MTNSVEYNTQYGYVQGASAYGTNATTPLVASITQGSGANAFNLAYTYDSRGNITSETRNGNTTRWISAKAPVRDRKAPQMGAFRTLRHLTGCSYSKCSSMLSSL